MTLTEELRSFTHLAQLDLQRRAAERIEELESQVDQSVKCIEALRDLVKTLQKERDQAQERIPA